MSPAVHPSVPHDARPPGRGAVRRYLETRGLVGAYARPHADTRILTADGVTLTGSHLPGPGGDGAVLVLHGFAANRRKPAYARLADGLATVAGVLALDLRGHGGSSGRCTWGDREVHDVRAGVRWLRAYGYRRVVVLGLSMGGTAALHAAASGVAIDAVATVSAPAWFHDPPQTVPLQRLHALWYSRLRRAGLRAVLGIRLDGPRGWRHPPHPVELVADLRVPLLVVHGEDDAYFPVAEAQAIVAAAGGPAVLWRRPVGFGHAEDGLAPAFVADLAAAIGQVLRTGAYPGAAA